MSRIRQPRRPTVESPLIRSLSLRLPGGYRLHDHEHGWAQVVYAARGVMSVEANAERWIVPPMRCLLVPGAITHRIEMIGETWMRTVYIRPDLAAGLPPGIRVLDVSPLLRELLLEIVHLGALDDENESHRSLTNILLDQLIGSRELGLALPLPSDPRARVVADRVLMLPGDDAPLAELTRGAGVSPRTAERLFLNETGLSFGRWRQQARLQLAVRRLAEGAAVTTVALECGYDSVSAFVVMFKRALGTTPGRYIGDSRADAADRRERNPD